MLFHLRVDEDEGWETIARAIDQAHGTRVQHKSEFIKTPLSHKANAEYCSAVKAEFKRTAKTIAVERGDMEFDIIPYLGDIILVRRRKEAQRSGQIMF